MNQSIRLNMPIEFINVTPINPLISRCEIKVCWVGDEPNRNRSIITKDVARQMANSIPGSPIVGYFNENNKDFEEHNRKLDFKDGKLKLFDETRPYGFVDLNAKVWFAKYQDPDGVIREYMVTQGYLWTKQYPECQRILDKGNNHSMELDEDTLNAFWTKNENGKPQFFIINEALVSKLCVLGDDFEPCFEGSNITAPTIQFSLDDGFKEQLFSMMNELTDLLKEGGTKVFTRYSVSVGDALWTALYSIAKPEYSIESVCEDGEQKFAVLSADDKYYRLNFTIEENNEISINKEEIAELASYTPDEEPQFNAEDIANWELSLVPVQEEPIVEEPAPAAEEQPEDPAEPETEEPKIEEPEIQEPEIPAEEPVKYVLEEIPEYTELCTKYAALEESYNTLLAEKTNLEKDYTSLVEFKKTIEKKDKEAMIKSFYMLSDDDKKDVIENIDTYSVEEIEAKLSIICVRNRVSFAIEEDNTPKDKPTTYNLNGHDDAFEDASVPAWVKAAMQVAKNMN